MSKSCKGLAMELVKCLSESDCIKVEKRSYRECAREKSPCIPSECVGLRDTYFNCKRGQCLGGRVNAIIDMVIRDGKGELEAAAALMMQVDMRARIRGNKGY